VDDELTPYLESNRRLWEEWTTVHQRSTFYDLPGFVEEMRAGRDRMRRFEVEEVGEVAGKHLLHLMCHLGTDTLAWARRGARVVGVDASARSIAVARSLADAVGLPATFIEADVYRLPPTLAGAFDVVYASHGVLGWLPDLHLWARAAASCLRPGGVFYLAEIHPFALTLDRRGEGDEALRVCHRYFPGGPPLASPVIGSYADRTATISVRWQYRWPHSLGEVVSAVAGAGLRVEFLHEFPFLVYQGLSFLEEDAEGLWRTPVSLGLELPLSFSLRAVEAR